MNKLPLIVVLIGGLLTVVGVFLPWQISGFSETPGWWITTRYGSPFIALAGGILTSMGAFGILTFKTRSLQLLIPMGGIIAIIGAGLGFSDVVSGAKIPEIGPGYGLYLCVAGGTLALLYSIWGVVGGIEG